MQIFNDKLVFILSGFQSWVAGITIFPFIFSKEKMRGNIKHLNHERIHIRQELECLLVLYPVIYYLHYGYNRIKGMNHITAYRNICFEREAYGNQSDVDYLKNRKSYSFIKYFRENTIIK